LGCLHERKREEERGKLIITRFIPTHSRAEKFSTQNLTNSRLEMRILISPSDACDMRKINNERKAKAPTRKTPEIHQQTQEKPKLGPCNSSFSESESE
jgi:hypothetical protein